MIRLLNQQRISWTFICPQRCPNIVGAFKHNQEKINGLQLDEKKANPSQGWLGGYGWHCTKSLVNWAIGIDYDVESYLPELGEVPTIFPILRQVPSSRSAFTRLTQDGVCLSTMLYPSGFYVSDAGVSFRMAPSCQCVPSLIWCDWSTWASFGSSCGHLSGWTCADKTCWCRPTVPKAP